jgi:hypothetical protein
MEAFGGLLRARRLSRGATQEELAQAQRAFTSGMHIVALVSAILLAPLAVVIVTWMRHRPVIGGKYAGFLRRHQRGL